MAVLGETRGEFVLQRGFGDRLKNPGLGTLC